jgi:hypothetical protein
MKTIGNRVLFPLEQNFFFDDVPQRIKLSLPSTKLCWQPFSLSDGIKNQLLESVE